MTSFSKTNKYTLVTWLSRARPGRFHFEFVSKRLVSIPKYITNVFPTFQKQFFDQTNNVWNSFWDHVSATLASRAFQFLLAFLRNISGYKSISCDVQTKNTILKCQYFGLVFTWIFMRVYIHIYIHIKFMTFQHEYCVDVLYQIRSNGFVRSNTLEKQNILLAMFPKNLTKFVLHAGTHLRNLNGV